jgi:hypothetical protein
VKQLSDIGAIVLIVWFVLYISTYYTPNATLQNLVLIGLHIWLGVQGNQLREKKLKKRGYELIKSIAAKGPEAAAAASAKEEPASAP